MYPYRIVSLQHTIISNLKISDVCINPLIDGRLLFVSKVTTTLTNVPYLVKSTRDRTTLPADVLFAYWRHRGAHLQGTIDPDANRYLLDTYGTDTNVGKRKDIRI